jgi:hypothetical protein
MCTVSWLNGPGGYEVFFNRDERPSRPARGPQLLHAEGIAYLAPHDVEAGGTWIAVNALGITVSMTNQYPQPAPPVPEERTSRGLLLASLVGAQSLRQIQARIQDLALERYEPFAIAAFEPQAPAATHSWNGADLVTEYITDPGFVLTSSGAIPPGLTEIRRAIFREAVTRDGLNPETLESVHRSHVPERGILSVCMHRDVAQSVSYSHIAVGPEEITFRYAPGPPCVTAVDAPFHLKRSDHLARS